MRLSITILPIAALVLPALAAAQTSETAAQTDDFHTTAEDIVVTAPFTRSLDLFGNVGVLEADDVVAELRPQIGDVLAAQAGISASSFAPGASRPIIRGFSGERVRVLVDGIGSIDVSNTSADHGVTIDPLTAERIEILRGPASLLFGSNAIGGAVNVFDRRIPRGVPDEPVHVDAITSYGSAARERMGGASIDLALTPELAFHVDGSYTRSSDLRIGGFQLSRQLRETVLDLAAEELAEGEVEEAEELTEAALNRGRVPNTAVETWTAGAGLALVNNGGSLGVSIGYYDSRYGVPARPGTGHHHGEGEGEGGEEEEAPVTLAVEQWRADVRGEVNMASGPFDRLRVRAGFADYQHIEFEGDEVGTRFFNQGIEARAELVQRERGGWSGASGVQYSYRDVNAIGAEAFLPQNDTTQFALFTLQEWRSGNVDIEAAGRWERTLVASNALGVRREFDAFSGALGLSWDLGDRSEIGITLSRGARAPSAEELLSDGPHIATQAYEIGNPDFGIERVWGIELVGRLRTGAIDISASAYHSWFSNFIYEAATGAELDDLPVFEYRQADARHHGFEIDASARLGHVGPFAINAHGVADYVCARLTGGNADLPRIPPLRLRGGLELEGETLTIGGEVEHAFAQNDVAAFETTTADFTLVNASIAWRPLAGRNVTLRLSGNNLFNVVARRHASFTRDYVPLAGRDIRISARLSF
jgi:iron complex outermembrane receptor protein